MLFNYETTAINEIYVYYCAIFICKLYQYNLFDWTFLQYDYIGNISLYSELYIAEIPKIYTIVYVS